MEGEVLLHMDGMDPEHGQVYVPTRDGPRTSGAGEGPAQAIVHDSTRLGSTRLDSARCGAYGWEWESQLLSTYESGMMSSKVRNCTEWLLYGTV